MPNTSESSQPGINAYLLAYGMWAILIIIGAASIFIWRETLLTLIAVYFGRQGSNRAFFQVGILVLGFAVFLTILGAEPYLRSGVERHRLGQRFLRLAIPLLVFGVVGLVITGILLARYGSQI